MARQQTRLERAKQEVIRARELQMTRAYGGNQLLVFAQNDLGREIASSAAGAGLCWAIGAGLGCFAILTFVFYEADTGDFAWLLELAAWGCCLGVAMAADHLARNRTNDKLRERYKAELASS
jgi:uncharacterized membrane protein